ADPRPHHTPPPPQRQALDPLIDALAELKADPVIASALGEHVLTHFVAAKEAEYDAYRIRVHEWEIDQYLGIY
ncbi:MAG: glutamine synthetase, partial [Firmicutes bacterium]|nr:glutamine synthetase [Bacillota bacterium]